MGTNYYLHKNACPHCKRSDEIIHIGKSSAGWCFTLRIDPDDGINDLEDWKMLFYGADSAIFDEYSEELSPKEMLDIIENRKGKEPASDCIPMRYKSYEDFLSMNDAMKGPNHLMRQRLSRFCVKHGEGTWDCVIGKFS